MAAVGVDNDASVVPECTNGRLLIRLPTLASKAHVNMLWSTTPGTCDAYVDTTKSAEKRY